jgi:putative MATE family efflux protein
VDVLQGGHGSGGDRAPRSLNGEIARLAIPSFGALAAEPLYLLVDTAVVGHLGTAALGGVAVAGTALSTVVWMCGFLTMGTTTRVALATGAGDPRRAGVVAVQAGLTALVIGTVAAAVFILAPGTIASLLGASGDVHDAAVTFLRIGALGLPFQLLAFAGHGFWRGEGHPSRSLAVVIVANALNGALTVLLVYGFDLGVAGSAWGTVCAQVVAAAWLALAIGARLRRVGVPLRVETDELTALLRAGVRITIRTAALVGVFLLATSVAARIGDAELAAHQIGMQLFTFLALSLDALAVPAQVLTGQALGAGEGWRARVVVTRVVRVGVIVGVLAGGLVAALAPYIPRLFTSDADVVDAATTVLLLLGLMQLPGAIAFVMDGALLGASDFAGVQRLMVIALLLALPMLIAVLRWPELGLAGLWVGLVVWMAARAGLTWRRWHGTVGARMEVHGTPAPARQA